MFLRGVLLIISLITNISHGVGIDAIRRHHSRVIKAELGDTVKLEWTIACDPKSMVLASCGYRNNGIIDYTLVVFAW